MKHNYIIYAGYLFGLNYCAYDIEVDPQVSSFAVLPDWFLFLLLGSQNLWIHFQQEYALSHWQNQSP